MLVDRMRLAKAIARELRQRERSNLVAVGVFGSVARGEDRTFSDLDLLVVTRRRRRGIRHEIRDGVLVTVHQVTPAEARREVTEGPWLNGPLSGWRGTRALYDPARLIARLRGIARRPSREAFRESARRDLIETLEEYGKVKNAIASGDLEEARSMVVWFTECAAGALLDIAAHVPRVYGRYFLEACQLGKVGHDMWGLRFDARTIGEIDRLSEVVWAGLLKRAGASGIRLPGLDRWPGGTRFTQSARGGPSRGP